MSDQDEHQLSDAFENAHGQLHRMLGIPEGEKIPIHKLEEAAGQRHNTLLRMRAQAALNMHHSHQHHPCHGHNCA